MNDDKFEQDIKSVLDKADEPGDAITRQLQLRRHNVLDKASVTGGSWYKAWLLPVASTAIFVMALLVMLPYGQQHEFSEIAELSPDDLEILSTMDIEDLEQIEFYDWLDMQEGQAG